MAAGTLILVILYFAIRGYFLSLAGVVARAAGIVCGYIAAFTLREDLAALLTLKFNLPPVALIAVSSAVIFFGTLFLVGVLVNGCFKVLTKLLPIFRSLFAKESLASRIGGATVNGALGASLVLVGLWVYGITLGKNSEPDTLQRVANRFGDSLFTYTRRLLEHSGDNHHTSLSSADTTPSASHRLSEALASLKTTPGAASYSDTPQRGTAEIRSVDNPDKHVYIEHNNRVAEPSPSTRHTVMSSVETSTATNINEQALLEQLANGKDIKALLQNEELQKMARDPAMRKKAMDLLQSHPELIKAALEDPRYRQLLEQLKSR